MEQIQVIGMKDLDDMEIDAINRIAKHYYPKIQRELRDDVSMIIHVKNYQKGGKYWNYSVHTRIISSKNFFASTKAHDKHINTALRMAFDDIIHQLHHRLHTDGQREFMKKSMKAVLMR